jgi:hypothetical protein
MQFVITWVLQYINVRIHNNDFLSEIEITISWLKWMNCFLPYFDWKYIFVIISIHTKVVVALPCSRYCEHASVPFKQRLFSNLNISGSFFGYIDRWRNSKRPVSITHWRGIVSQKYGRTETREEISKLGWILLLICRGSERWSREPEFQRSIPSKFYDVAFHNYVFL